MPSDPQQNEHAARMLTAAIDPITAPADVLAAYWSIVDVARLIVPGAFREKPIAVFTAYFDEAGSHQGSPWLTMGGFVGKVADWEAFETGWHALLEKHGVPHPLHAKSLARMRRPARDRFMLEFGRSLRGTSILGFICAMDEAAYDEVFSRRERGRRRDSAYGMCFRFSAAEVLERAKRESDQPVSFVLECGHRNAEDAVRIFKQMTGVAERRGWSMGGIAFAKKEDYGALQAADFAAHDVHKNVASIVAGSPVGDMLNQALVHSGAPISVSVFDRARILELRSVSDAAHEAAKAFGRRAPRGQG